MAEQIVEIVTQGVSQGQACLNRYHFLDSDGVADPLILCSDFTTHITSAFLEAFSTTFQWNSLQYQVVYPAVGLARSYATGYPLVGTDPGDPLPSLVAASIKWVLGDTVGLGGAPATPHIKRGGKRFGGMTEAEGSGNAFNLATKRSDLDGIANALVAFPPDAWQFCVVHFPPSPAPVPPALTSPRLPPTRYCLVTGHVLAQNWGSQVSRKPGHGK